MQTINYHLMDGRGVYIATVQIDPMAALPGRGTLSALPPEEPGKTRMWRGEWAQVPDAEVPPVPAPPSPPVPQRVTMRQARLALLGAGLLAGIDAAINGLPSPQKEAARIEWEYSQEVQRHNGFVSVLAPMLGMTEAQTDALFLVAEGL